MLLATGFQGVSVPSACPLHEALSVDTPIVYCFLVLATVHFVCVLPTCILPLLSHPLAAPLTMGSWRPFSINTRTLLKVIGHTGHVRLCLCASWPSTLEYGFQGTFPVFHNLLRRVILETLPLFLFQDNLYC